jgi:hypothetical protein
MIPDVYLELAKEGKRGSCAVFWGAQELGPAENQ